MSDNGFSQVSFVNSINTIKGGTHVAHVTEQVVEHVLKVVKGKNRGGMDIKPNHVRNHLFVFVNTLIENPAFDSQTKETLTTKQTKFGSTCELSEKMIKQVMKSGIVEMILDWAKAKQKVDLGRQLKGSTKNQTRVLGIPKLEDANDAGGKNSHECTLILTEGDSAKSLAVAGLSIVGRDHYGVFPLKGKVLNVRDANYKQVTANAEIQNLLKIMGLDVKKEYDSTRGLRYGSIMLMTDQDHDGSHIKGLLINLVHHWWPSLMRMGGVLKEFVTPIVKVWKAGNKDSERRDEKSFFTVAEYEKWRAATQNGKGWKTKYYKGLGTSTAKEAKEYFRDIEHHEIQFKWRSDEDGEAIDLAFNKKRADDRKNWINSYEDGAHVDHTQPQITYFDFVHKELVQFAKYDVSRSVPSVVDGFKPSQRKVLFCSFKKKLKNDIKVAQFVGYISEQSAYHHGETSLENTIINLAQNYVGSNNVNLLVPSGQFGTRLQGGKDHAASRYIYTRLALTTRLMFHPDDDPILAYLDEEGQKIEPSWYCPILPTVLINGADGIGTGWSTSVPNYNPRDLIRNIQRMLRGEPMREMHPWYKGFRGALVPNEKEPGKYDVFGCIEKKSDTVLAITELPIRTWTQSYKEFLEELMPQDGKKSEDASDHTITDFREYHTENSVHFEVMVTPEKMHQLEHAGLEKTFKLKSSIATSNMVLFDEDGKIARYNSALDILKDFCVLRRKVYERRKAYLVAKLTREKEILSNKARFILLVVSGELELRKRKKADLLKDLKQRGFKPMSELDAIMKAGGATCADEAEGTTSDPAAVQGATGEAAAAEKTDYDYLLGMNLWSLTYEKVEEIKKLLDIKKQELDVLQRTTIEEMWDRDLEALWKGLDEMDALEAEEAEAAASAAEGRKRKAGRQGGRAARPPVQKQPPGPPKRRNTDDDDDRAYLSRSLCTGSSVGECQKTTWGTNAPMQRTADDLGLLSACSRDTQAARGRGRGDKSGALSRSASKPLSVVQEKPPAVEKQAEEATGARLLSRLLSRPGPALSETEPGGNTLASHSELGSHEDLFSYLKSSSSLSSSSAPVKQRHGMNTGIITSDPIEITEDKANSSAQTPQLAPPQQGRGRGRARSRSADPGRSRSREPDRPEVVAPGSSDLLSILNVSRKVDLTSTSMRTTSSRPPEPSMRATSSRPPDLAQAVLRGGASRPMELTASNTGATNNRPIDLEPTGMRTATSSSSRPGLTTTSINMDLTSSRRGRGRAARTGRRAASAIVDDDDEDDDYFEGQTKRPRL